MQDTAPVMKRKGRLRAGMDADITVFDPNTIRGRATYDQSAQTSIGVRYLIVNGTLLINNGELDRRARPGKPVRREVWM
jgi:N-acyl-D-glutamate deacylase